MLLLLFHCHFFACLLYIIATCEPRWSTTWFAVEQAARPGHGSNDALSRWLFCFYWALTTFATVGYGDVTPVTNQEYVVTLVFTLLNLFLAALIVGNVTSLVLLMAEKRRVYRQRHSDLMKYARVHGLPSTVEREMSNYLVLRHNAQESRAPDVLEDLPPLLRSKVARHLHLPVLAASPLFSGCSEGFVDHIACNLHFDLFMPGVELVACGEVGSAELFVLVSGTADVLAPPPDAEEAQEEAAMRCEEAGAEDGSQYTTVASLSAPGESFGEITFFFSLPQPFTIRSTSLCRVLSLKSTAWATAAVVHPRDAHTAALNVRIALAALAARADAPVALQAVIDPLLSDVSAALAARDAERVSEMCFAAARNDVLSMRRSLAAGASVGGADYDGRCPLHVAAAKGAEAAVSYLLDHGAPPNAIDCFGNSPLLEAVLGNHITVAAMLRNSGAVLGLQEAASLDAPPGSPSVKLQPPVSARRVKDAGTMLCGAASAGDLPLVTALLSNGLSARSADYNARTALHLAAAFGRTQVLALLLQEGGDASAVDAFGRTPLLEACRGCHEAEAEMLLAAGARLGLGSGGSADARADRNQLLAGGEMCAAAACGDTEYLRRLLRYGCPPDATDYDARTAAHLASAEGMRSVVLLLLEHGANFHVLDRWGHTPLREAERNGHKAIAATVRVLQPSAPSAKDVAVRRSASASASAPAARPTLPASPSAREAAAAEEVGSEAAQELAGSAEELASAGGGAGRAPPRDGSLRGSPEQVEAGERRRMGEAKSERLGPWLAQSSDAKE
jgi:ankyrin repeat protein/CRP-like cAMP-binding protein